jgi:hypothetical protein
MGSPTLSLRMAARESAWSVMNIGTRSLRFHVKRRQSYLADVSTSEGIQPIGNEVSAARCCSACA